MTIRSGPLAGKKWIATTGYSFITANFETYKINAFVDNFSAASVFYDIGAHVGYFTAIACDVNSGRGWVYAFEPRPMNAKFFRRHVAMNGFTNVTLFQAAVAVEAGEARFNSNTGSATGHLSSAGDLVVKVMNIDKEFEEGRMQPPDFIKVDVEGGEIEVLKSCRKVIGKCRPKLMIATHSRETHDFVMKYLEENQYRYEILNPDRIKGDEEIMAWPLPIH